MILYKNVLFNLDYGPEPKKEEINMNFVAEHPYTAIPILVALALVVVKFFKPRRRLTEAEAALRSEKIFRGAETLARAAAENQVYNLCGQGKRLSDVGPFRVDVMGYGILIFLPNPNVFAPLGGVEPGHVVAQLIVEDDLSSSFYKKLDHEADFKPDQFDEAVQEMADYVKSFRPYPDCLKL